MIMFHKLKSNDKVYWINLDHIAFIVENNQRIVLFFTSGEHIHIEDFSEYQKLLKIIERRK